MHTVVMVIAQSFLWRHCLFACYATERLCAFLCFQSLKYHQQSSWRYCREFLVRLKPTVFSLVHNGTSSRRSESPSCHRCRPTSCATSAKTCLHRSARRNCPNTQAICPWSRATTWTPIHTSPVTHAQHVIAWHYVIEWYMTWIFLENILMLSFCR